MDDNKTTAGRLGQPGSDRPAVLRLRRKPEGAPAAMPVRKAITSGSQRKPSLVLNTVSVPA